MLRLLLFPFRFVLGLILLLLLSPLLFYLLTPFVPILVLLAVCVVFSRDQVMDDGTPKSRAILEGIGVAGIFVVAIALCRAIMVLGYGWLLPTLLQLEPLLPPEWRLPPEWVLAVSQLPSPLMFLDYPLRQAVPLFGPRFVPWFDLTLALVGLVALIGQSILDGAWRVLTLRHIENMPRSRARSVPLGLAELEGKARPLEGEDASKPILRYTWGGGSASNSEARSFYLEDETGRILVDPAGTQCLAFVGGKKKAGQLPKRIFGPRACEVLLTRRLRGRGSSSLEAVLMPGDDVYVIGTVTKKGRRTPIASDRSEAKVIRPRRGSLGMFGFYDIFFLSDIREMQARHHLRAGLRYAILWAFGCSLLCAGFGFQAYRGLEDLQTAYRYVEPAESTAHAEPAAPVTPVLERSYDIPYLGRKTVAEMLVIAREGPPGNMLTVLPLLDYLGARELAIVELKKVTRESDNPLRVQIARQWLHSWIREAAARNASANE